MDFIPPAFIQKLSVRGFFAHVDSVRCWFSKRPAPRLLAALKGACGNFRIIQKSDTRIMVGTRTFVGRLDLHQPTANALRVLERMSATSAITRLDVALEIPTEAQEDALSVVRYFRRRLTILNRRGNSQVTTYKHSTYWRGARFRSLNVAVYPRVGQVSRTGRRLWGKMLGGYAARIEFRVRTRGLESRGIRSAADIRRLNLVDFIRQELRLCRLRHRAIERRHAEDVAHSAPSRRRLPLRAVLGGDVRRVSAQEGIDALQDYSWWRRDRCVKPLKMDWLLARLSVGVASHPPSSPIPHANSAADRGEVSQRRRL
jgi:hypothetical protein